MNHKEIIENLSTQTIYTLRDLALKLERTDLHRAKEIMQIAHLAKPKGPFIRKKLETYNRLLAPLDNELKSMLNTGELAIVPIGFRCHTKLELFKALNFSQMSLPFDSGFFPPSSVISVIKNPVINMKYSDHDIKTHTVCIKDENHSDPMYGTGIKFHKSNYREINAFAKKKDESIHMYLDADYGYYTLDQRHQYVLAHFNWHEYADHKHSYGISDPKVNIKKINNMMNKRIQRMFDICKIAKHKLFVFHKDPVHNYMMIDDDYYDLNDLEELKDVIKETFGSNSYIVDLNEVDSAKKILDLIK